jgi:hypothetical protein
MVDAISPPFPIVSVEVTAAVSVFCALDDAHGFSAPEFPLQTFNPEVNFAPECRVFLDSIPEQYLLDVMVLADYLGFVKLAKIISAHVSCRTVYTNRADIESLPDAFSLAIKRKQC